MRTKLLFFAALLCISSSPIHEGDEVPYPNITTPNISDDMKRFIYENVSLDIEDDGPYPANEDITINYHLYSELPLREDLNKITIVFHISKDIKKNKTLYFAWDDLPSFHSGDRINYHGSFTSETVSMYKYSMKTNFNDEPVYISIKFTYNIASSFFDILFPLYAYNSQSIDPLDYRVHPFTNSNYVVRKNINKRDESFLFDDYSDFVEVDAYSRFRFDYLKFKYRFDRDFTYKSAYIAFYDKHNIFTKLHRNSDNQVYLPIELIQAGEDVSIKLKPLYVDKYSLEMSDKEHGVSTNYLFIKKGYERFLSDYRFDIVLSGLGICDTHVTHQVEPLLNQSIISHNSASGYSFIRGVR